MTNRARTVAALVPALGGCASAWQTYDAQGAESLHRQLLRLGTFLGYGAERRLGSCAARVTHGRCGVEWRRRPWHIGYARTEKDRGRGKGGIEHGR